MNANDLQPAEALLHLQETVNEEAHGCGRPETLVVMFTAMRSRFALSTWKAKSKLSDLKKYFKTSLQENAAEVDRLAMFAYNITSMEYDVRKVQ